MTEVVFELEFSLAEDTFMARSNSGNLHVKAPTLSKLSRSMRDAVRAGVAVESEMPSQIALRAGTEELMRISVE